MGACSRYGVCAGHAEPGALQSVSTILGLRCPARSSMEKQMPNRPGAAAILADESMRIAMGPARWPAVAVQMTCRARPLRAARIAEAVWCYGSMHARSLKK